MKNVNLKPEKMRSLAKALPDSSRPFDDGLYRALDIYFKEVLGRSVNGTTYAGIQAQTTGAPQNHWSACGAPFIFYHCRTVNSLMRAGCQSLQSLWLKRLQEKAPFQTSLG
ncbi:uncharacterized protein LOC131248299 isoform X3 [Magnolia sinica]|uniref:uncharacterized protein LOC131248299 isoform X3 n=1 Tax=Magnolia sinica TaxID=86752 RepID=UPI00265AAC41|nr:uncharacterized protein LOC131248299 isoform X3 [Magnolia sinica]